MFCHRIVLINCERPQTEGFCRWNNGQLILVEANKNVKAAAFTFGYIIKINMVIHVIL